MTLWKWLGFFALPAIFLPFLTAPVAILRLVWLADWNQAAGIALALVLARGMRGYARRLAPPFAAGFGASRRPGSGPPDSGGDVIDTVAVEPPREIA